MRQRMLPSTPWSLTSSRQRCKRRARPRSGVWLLITLPRISCSRVLHPLSFPLLHCASPSPSPSSVCSIHLSLSPHYLSILHLSFHPSLYCFPSFCLCVCAPLFPHILSSVISSTAWKAEEKRRADQRAKEGKEPLTRATKQLRPGSESPIFPRSKREKYKHDMSRSRNLKRCTSEDIEPHKRSSLVQALLRAVQYSWR